MDKISASLFRDKFIAKSLQKVPENKLQNQSRISPIYEVQEDIFSFDFWRKRIMIFVQKNFEFTENNSRRQPD